MKNYLTLCLLGTMPLAYGQVLYDNGPFSTGTTHSSGATAPTGTTWSEIQSNGTATNGTLGYSVNYLNATSIGSLHQADDFTVERAGGTCRASSYMVSEVGVGRVSSTPPESSEFGTVFLGLLARM